ncbi:sulfotransferase family protein [Dyella monticola]|uniref:Sulfotransferase family protein n=1 Tax=Dyella monticola TaxID=1927958 RepID=A0A370X937_9GAMM|nr:sulfotransferase [Dyella monticola]RDS84924.1 sulfotransferase family protein [Dyella monticola]
MSSLPDLQARLIHAFNRNDWPSVLQLAAQVQLLVPRESMAPFMAGVAHMQLGQLPHAVTMLRTATQLEPNRADFAANYAKALSLTRQMQEAQQAAERALALGPADPMTFEILGVVFSQSHAHARALEMFRRLVTMVPNHPPAHFYLAFALIAMGDMDAAEKELEACVRLDPNYGMAHLKLAGLRKQTAERNHVERLKALLVRYANHPGAQLYMNMALAKEYDDLGQYASAFEHFRRGKAVGKERRVRSMERDDGIFQRLISSFSQAPVASGDPGDAPIFIIGMPRTGTTLLDRILSSHPDVYSAGELVEFPATLQRVYGGNTPLLLDPQLPARVAQLDWRKLGGDYLAVTQPHAVHARHFIDKMPHNFLYAGFIASALPNAKIVCLRRHPLDTCLGNFRHLFEQETSYYDYSFDIMDAGRYYIGFERLMAHWSRVFPGRIFDVQYEKLVTAQEETVRGLLAFCGLPWNDACLQSERNAAPVNTPLAWQVRSPVNASAVGRWKHYAAELAPLQDLLRNAGIAAD